MPIVGGAFDDFLGDGEAHVGVFGNAGFVVGDGDHGGAVFLHQRQHALQALLFARDGIDQRLALVDREPRLERLDDRRVDRQGNVDGLLHQLDAFGEDARLVGERNAGVDVEHLRARLDLRERVGDDARIVALRHFRRQQLAPRRIDPLADHHEAAFEADDDFLFGGGDDGFGHGAQCPCRS